MSLTQKDQLLEISPRVRLGKPIICGRLSVSRDKPKPSTRRSAERQSLPGTALRLWSSNKSSLYDVTEQAESKSRLPQTLCTNDLAFGFNIYSTPRKWWSRTGSNRRHPACKAGALPAELRPLIVPMVRRWWAWEDLNLRPHAYQARALTN